jgi:hypothetical protein
LAFLTQNKAKLCKILIITLVFEKNAIFFAENGRKWQKIVIITSTPESWHSEASIWHQILICRIPNEMSVGFVSYFGVPFLFFHILDVFISQVNKQTMHIKPIIHDSIARILLKTLYSGGI